MIRTTGILRNILAAVLLTAAAACTEEMDVPGSTATEGREATVRLSVSAAPVGAGMPGSRALPEGVDEGTGENYEVEDIWLMEYNDAGEIVGSPQYYTKEELKEGINVPIILPVGEAVFKCVVVANTHIPDRINEAIGDVSTLAKLRALCRKIETPDDMHNKKHDAETNTVKGGDLLMNCVMDITSETTALDCKLYRNIAKFTLKLKNLENSGVNINTVQLCNVPDKMFYADQLYGSEQGTKYPSPTLGEAGFRTWEVEYVTDDTPKDRNGAWTFEYYLSRNCRGTNGNTAGPSEKNRNAPDFATYVEIMAEDTQNGTPIRYRFYLGENMTDNFNVIPNRHYILPVTIEGKGASTDSRVEDLGTLKLPESNCYIVNPLNGGAQRLHSVPITRINKFWDSVDGKIATDDQGNLEDNHVYHDTKWVAEVIWQDAPTRLFDFCDKDGNPLYNEDGTTPVDFYTGTGESDFRFKPREGARGNVLIGVRRETQDKNNYLWSWHLWITDFNPDERISSWNEEQYAYSVSGGEIHRYAAAGTNSPWETTYRNKYIMDRNLGAMSASSTDFEGSRGFYYQYGRKDPIPHANAALYDINGDALNCGGDNSINSNKQGPVYFYEAIKQPSSYFVSTTSEWVNENKYKANLWNNPDWYTESTSSTKSIFDPCPSGWKLPEIGVWNSFTKDNFIGDFNKGWKLRINSHNINETVWYPSSGYRNFSTGGISGEEKEGYYWLLQLNVLLVTKSQLSQMSYSNRVTGFPVRPIQDPDYRP